MNMKPPKPQVSPGRVISEDGSSRDYVHRAIEARLAKPLAPIRLIRARTTLSYFALGMLTAVTIYVIVNVLRGGL